MNYGLWACRIICWLLAALLLWSAIRHRWRMWKLIVAIVLTTVAVFWPWLALAIVVLMILTFGG